MEPDITIISAAFSEMVDLAPSLSTTVNINLGAVKASYERARFPEKRIANAASHSIAAAVMAVAAAGYALRDRIPALDAPVTRLFQHALALESTGAVRHVKTLAFTPDPSWGGPEGGPWVKQTARHGVLKLVHIPGIPGGNWTIEISDVPCLFGDEPSDVERRTKDLMALVDRVTVASMFRNTAVF